MIRINLANSLIAKAGTQTPSGSQIDPKQMAAKVSLLLLPLVAVMIWESISLRAKTAQYDVIRQRAEVLSKKLDSFGSVDDMVRNVSEQKKDLDDKFSVLRQIFGLRSQKIQTLVELRDKIPQNTWLTRVSFQDKTVSIVGFAGAIADVQTFASALSANTELFGNVSTTNTVSEKVQNVDYFKFDIFIKLKE